jgi:hypothetical protein
MSLSGSAADSNSLRRQHVRDVVSYLCAENEDPLASTGHRRARSTMRPPRLRPMRRLSPSADHLRRFQSLTRRPAETCDCARGRSASSRQRVRPGRWSRSWSRRQVVVSWWDGEVGRTRRDGSTCCCGTRSVVLRRSAQQGRTLREVAKPHGCQCPTSPRSNGDGKRHRRSPRCRCQALGVSLRALLDEASAGSAWAWVEVDVDRVLTLADRAPPAPRTRDPRPACGVG